MEDLSHWKLIQTLTAQEAGLLIAGVDPYNKEVTSKEVARGLVYERAEVDPIIETELTVV